MTVHEGNAFGSRASLTTGAGDVTYFRLAALEDEDLARLDLVPMTVKILLENLMRLAGTEFASEDDVAALAHWGQKPLDEREFSFSPARVLLQDFTGVPAVVDLAAMRSAIQRAGGDPAKVDPLVPVDLVIDHSVQVDAFANDRAFQINVEREYERNHERYSLLRWAQQAFNGFRVVPPGMGIVHQVNLEHLATVVRLLDDGVAVPDTLVGTDSHTTMINGLGVLGWGVGGIEAEAAMLGQPVPLLTPIVVGFKFTGDLQTGVTATDLVLTVTEMLRKHGVVGKFVEFYGGGLAGLTVADRATLSNMSPEYGAPAGLFPIDDQTLAYMRLTGRPAERIDLVERYAKQQGMFRTEDTPDPEFSETLELDLSTVEPSVAGPRRPQDRVALTNVWPSFQSVYKDAIDASAGPVRIDIGRWLGEGGSAEQPHTPEHPDPSEEAVVRTNGEVHLHHGSVVIAAITSCTNTSNPTVMLGAGLLAKKAVEKGLRSKPWVKTSMAPGSRVVTEYLDNAGLTEYLEQLGFHVVGYGCTTCIGNSGPLPDPVSHAIDEHDLAVVSVLSGNRNFEGRINPDTRANYLASPPLVVAYALAGRMDIDLNTEPLGRDSDGEPVYLSDIWPSSEEIKQVVADAIRSDMFTKSYGDVFTGDERWRKIEVPEGDRYTWPDSTYVRKPSFFEGIEAEPKPVEPIEGARLLAVLGDSVTTDHISPAGAIKKDSPAGKWLIEQGVEVRDFNSYGSRRGNHEVMIRGTFANVRLRNALVEREGGFTRHFPDGEETTIYEAAMRYADEGVPLIVLAGKEYGSGSSRDWAAKGTNLLGVRAVIAESFERIHRSNLIGMGVLPLQISDADQLEDALNGDEVFEVSDLKDGETETVTVTAKRDGAEDVTFEAKVRIDTPNELSYFQNGGILHRVLRHLRSRSRPGA